jgi:Ca2+-binding RTX toxin-like protein
LQVDHIYITAATYVVQATATDQDGAVSSVATTSIQVVPVIVSDGIMLVGGESGSDNIVVSGRSLVHNGTVYSLAEISEVRVWTGAGDDRIDLGNLAIKTFIDGGAGNDLLTGGSADDVIFGRAGDDMITGGAGHDFLVGGTGKDRLVGAAGNDILVALDLAAELDLATLRAIARTWAQSQIISDEAAESLADEDALDSDSDSLTGSAGADLFIISSGDKITDFQFGPRKAKKDGDVVIKDGKVVT